MNTFKNNASNVCFVKYRRAVTFKVGKLDRVNKQNLKIYIIYIRVTYQEILISIIIVNDVR